MGLTPEDIQGKRFHDAFRGYNHEEVDIFLDEVAAAFETVFRNAQAVRARVEELEAELDEVRGTEGMLKRTLLAAQRASDEAIAEAKAEAARLVAAAADEATAAVASAKQRAEEIIAGAHTRQSEIEELDSRLYDLHATHRATLRAHLEEQLRALDDLPALPGPEAVPVVAAPPARPAAPGPVADVAAAAEPDASPEPAPEGHAGAGPADHPETPPPRRVSREPFRPGGLVNPVTHTGETD
jgi:cell division initiation protein